MNQETKTLESVEPLTTSEKQQVRSGRAYAAFGIGLFVLGFVGAITGGFGTMNEIGLGTSWLLRVLGVVFGILAILRVSPVVGNGIGARIGYCVCLFVPFLKYIILFLVLKNASDVLSEDESLSDGTQA